MDQNPEVSARENHQDLSMLSWQHIKLQIPFSPSSRKYHQDSSRLSVRKLMPMIHSRFHDPRLPMWGSNANVFPIYPESFRYIQPCYRRKSAPPLTGLGVAFRFANRMTHLILRKTRKFSRVARGNKTLNPWNSRFCPFPLDFLSSLYHWNKRCIDELTRNAVRL